MLLRDPTAFPQQDRFGKADNPPGERGNCVQTCLAALLDLPLSEVPHFYDTDEDSDTQHAKSQAWLAERGWVKLWIPWDWIAVSYQQPIDRWLALDARSLVMVSGKSPRGDWSHVVIGTISDNDWSLVHDPHPSQEGLDGTPYGIWLITAVPHLPSTI